MAIFPHCIQGFPFITIVELRGREQIGSYPDREGDRKTDGQFCQFFLPGSSDGSRARGQISLRIPPLGPLGRDLGFHMGAPSRFLPLQARPDPFKGLRSQLLLLRKLTVTLLVGHIAPATSDEVVRAHNFGSICGFRVKGLGLSELIISDRFVGLGFRV